jgi:hypothetical protein
MLNIIFKNEINKNKEIVFSAHDVIRTNKMNY